MNRRTYLRALGLGLAALAGCADSSEQGEEPTPTPPGISAQIPGRSDLDLPIPSSEIIYATVKDAYPAIVDPAVGRDWGGVELPGYAGDAATPRLRASDRVIGVERDGQARAYPLRLLSAHEIVNDDVGGPLLVTYCPLCGSGVVARRVVDGEPALFGVSGRLWQSDLVFYDQPTGSLWSQILATAIRGPQTGTSLDLLPSTLTTWGQWQSAHPETTVVRPPPESRTIDGSGPGYYGRNRYEAYADSDSIGVGQNPSVDDRLDPKVQVLGVVDAETAKAFPLPAVREAGVINDTVGTRPVVVAATDSTLVAYERTVDGTTLQFTRADERQLAAGGSRWEILTGRAVDGPYEGARLTSASRRSQLFWFAWAEFYPETEIYG